MNVGLRLSFFLRFVPFGHDRVRGKLIGLKVHLSGIFTKLDLIVTNRIALENFLPILS